MEISVLRAEKLWQQAGAYSVRIQGMARQHNIPLENEFDEHDGAETKYIVLLDEGYPVATCRFYELSQTEVMLGRVVVLPEYRGNKLGKKTIEEAESWIKELGFSTVRIESRTEAVLFYEKMGYELVSKEVIRGCTFDCVAMEKSLI